MTTQQTRALALIAAAVLDAVAAAGPTGAPAGVLYAAMMARGCTLSQFESLMGALVGIGKLTHDAKAHLYYIAGTQS